MDCAGIWMPPHVLLQLIQLLSPKSAPPIVRNRSDGEGNLPCPECQRDMQKVWVGDANGSQLPGLPREGKGRTIDRCPQHGSWFDHSELQSVLTGLASVKK